jgi:hypothetical protein
MTDKNKPTVFHITHWKAGSQWVMGVLFACVANRIVRPKVGIAQFYEDPIVPGTVYPAVYVPRPHFQSTLFPELDLDVETYQPSPSDGAEAKNWYNFVAKKMPVIKFLIIRDLRDAMVSLYFSLKVSHPVISENVAKGRQSLNEMDFEEGFIHLLDTRAKNSVRIQHSWMPVCRKGDMLLIRYEDLIADEQTGFAKIIEYCQIDIPPAKLEDIVNENSFRKQAGRKPGDEDVSSHYRKGISGDWKNHCTDRIKAKFKEKFGQILIDTGYENDMDW